MPLQNIPHTGAQGEYCLNQGEQFLNNTVSSFLFMGQYFLCQPNFYWGLQINYFKTTLNKQTLFLTFHVYVFLNLEILICYMTSTLGMTICIPGLTISKSAYIPSTFLRFQSRIIYVIYKDISILCSYKVSQICFHTR